MKAMVAGLQGRRIPMSNTIWKRDAPLAVVSPLFRIYFLRVHAHQVVCTVPFLGITNSLH